MAVITSPGSLQRLGPFGGAAGSGVGGWEWEESMGTGE